MKNLKIVKNLKTVKIVIIMFVAMFFMINSASAELPVIQEHKVLNSFYLGMSQIVAGEEFVKFCNQFKRSRIIELKSDGSGFTYDFNKKTYRVGKGYTKSTGGLYCGYPRDQFDSIAKIEFKDFKMTSFTIYYDGIPISYGVSSHDPKKLVATIFDDVDMDFRERKHVFSPNELGIFTNSWFAGEDGLFEVYYRIVDGFRYMITCVSLQYTNN